MGECVFECVCARTFWEHRGWYFTLFASRKAFLCKLYAHAYADTKKMLQRNWKALHCWCMYNNTNAHVCVYVFMTLSECSIAFVCFYFDFASFCFFFDFAGWVCCCCFFFRSFDVVICFYQFCVKNCASQKLIQNVRSSPNGKTRCQRCATSLK